MSYRMWPSRWVGLISSARLRGGARPTDEGRVRGGARQKPLQGRQRIKYPRLWGASVSPSVHVGVRHRQRFPRTINARTIEGAIAECFHCHGGVGDRFYCNLRPTPVAGFENFFV